MRLSTRAAVLLCIAVSFALLTGCAKKKVQLEMTRETVIVDPVIESLTIDPQDYELEVRKIAPEIQSRYGRGYGPGAGWCRR